MLITRYDLKQDNVFKLPHTDACLHWNVLTHLSQLLPHICVSELDHHWFRQWLVVCSVPSHYLNQNWLIVNWTLGNKFQWNFNRKSIIFIRENAFGIVVCHNTMTVILSGERWVCTYFLLNLLPQCRLISDTFVCVDDWPSMMYTRLGLANHSRRPLMHSAKEIWHNICSQCLSQEKNTGCLALLPCVCSMYWIIKCDKNIHTRTFSRHLISH